MFLSPTPTERILQIFRDNIWKIKNRSIGLLHPSNNIVGDIQVFLRESLPANIHKIISGKVCLSLTRLSDGQNVLVSDFQSKDEVVDVSSGPMWVWSNKQGSFILEATQRGQLQATCPIS